MGSSGFSRLSLGEVVQSVATVSRNDTHAFICALFNQSEGLLALPVFDAPDQYGLVHRAAFFSRYAHIFGRDLFASKPIFSIVDESPLIFDHMELVTEVATTITAPTEGNIPQAILVLKEGHYLGIATTTDVMRAVAAQAQAALTQLQLAQDELIESETFASLGQLVAGVAHEVNTPVGVALTAASFFRDETTKLTRAIAEGRLKKSDLDLFLRMTSEASQMILGNLQQAASLIQSFKQIAVDQVAQCIGQVFLEKLLSDVTASIQMHFRRSGREIMIECPSDLIIQSNAGALTQVITNLVMNANVHAFEGREGGRVSLSAHKGEGFVHICIADDGRGIPAEYIDKIFEPFFTTRRGRGGTGLGLHIVHNLVYQTLKGRLTLESEVGRGTTFSIYLPDDIENADSVYAASVMSGATSSRRRRRASDPVV